MTYYGNRGMTLESLVTYVNKRYREMGIGVIEKQHTHFIPIRNGKGDVVSCKVEEKATVDFMGRLGPTPVAIETKHTKTDSIRWDAVQDHQSAFLTDFCAKGEGISLVLVSFDLKRFYAVPWECWKAARDAWREAQRKGVRTAETIYLLDYDWETNGKASVKASDLLDEWEVEMGGRVGLDYLRRYI